MGSKMGSKIGSKMGSKMGSNRVPKVAIPFEREAETCLSKEREARFA